MKELEKFTTAEIVLLLTLAAVQFTHIIDFMIIMPLGPPLLRLFSITPAQFSAIVSAYTFSAGIFAFLGSFFLDRVPRKTALLVVEGADRTLLHYPRLAAITTGCTLVCLGILRSIYGRERR